VQFENVYEDSRRADSYAKLEFPCTYYLAYRDLPAIITKYAKGKTAIDFGCGTGRSTRFVKNIGFDVVGVDISPDMIAKARELDSSGDYRLMPNNTLSILGNNKYDLAISVFTFDNIPARKTKISLFNELKSALNNDGIIINLVSSPEIYTHEWASFTTKDFPENRNAKSGDKVKIIMTDVEDRRPVEDIIWFDDAYRDVYLNSGLKLLETMKPLADENESFDWINETKIAPWVIYVLSK
jgi:SAM-dependent methyltransferase